MGHCHIKNYGLFIRNSNFIGHSIFYLATLSYPHPLTSTRIETLSILFTLFP